MFPREQREWTREAAPRVEPGDTGQKQQGGTAEGSSSRNPGHNLQPAHDGLVFNVTPIPPLGTRLLPPPPQGGQGWINHFQVAAERGDSQTQGGTSVSKATLRYGAPGRFGPAGHGGEVGKQDTGGWGRSRRGQ